VPIEVPEQPTPIAPQPTAEAPPAPAEAPPLALTQLQEAWQRTVLPAVQSRSIPVASLLGEARPAALADETLTLEFPASADFHRRQAEEPKNVGVIRDALYEVTGHRLAVTLSLGEDEEPAEDEDDELSEDALISMFKDTFDAQEVEEPR
jgi:DNA polymerase-3 subunit gamma/tau